MLIVTTETINGRNLQMLGLVRGTPLFTEELGQVTSLM